MTSITTQTLDEIIEAGKAATCSPWKGDEFEITAPKAPTLLGGNVKLVLADDYHLNEWDAKLVILAGTHMLALATELKRAREALVIADEALTSAAIQMQVYSPVLSDVQFSATYELVCEARAAIQELKLTNEGESR